MLFNTYYYTEVQMPLLMKKKIHSNLILKVFWSSSLDFTIFKIIPHGGLSWMKRRRQMYTKAFILARLGFIRERFSP